MPRTVAPVQPYMADNSAIIKAMQAGWEMGMKMPTTAGSITAGVQQGMQMANQYASFQDKYGADAQAAKERKAQMENLQIKSAQQQLDRGDLQLEQMQAEQPYFGQKAKNEAETSDINLELAKLNQTRAKATTANVPTEISNKNAEEWLGITGKAIDLTDKGRAMGNELQKNNARLALSNQLTAATTADDFVGVRKSINEYWGKNGMSDYDKLNAQFALEAKVKGVANDPKISGYINSGSPLTVAGVEKSTLTYQKIANDSEKKLNGWAANFHSGGQFQLDSTGEPVKDPVTGAKVGEDWSKLKAIVTENFQTPKTDINGNPVYGNDGLPVYESPKVGDVMANINFVRQDDKGKFVFRNAAKTGNNTFSVDPNEGNKLVDLIHYRDNFKNAQDGINTGTKTLRYMTDQQKSAITPDELTQLRKQFATPQASAPSTDSGNGTTSAGGGPGVLPEIKSPQQELAIYAKQWRSVYGKGGTGEGKADPITLTSLKLLMVNDPAFYSEVVKTGSDTRISLPESSSGAAKSSGALTPASLYSPLP